MTESAETDLFYFRHILQCIRHVKEDSVGGRAAWDASRTVRDSVLRNLQVMAESTQRLSERARRARPDIPWDNVAGFRNRSVHDYFHVDHDLVWRVIAVHLPVLEAAVIDLSKRLDELWPPSTPSVS